MPAAARPPRIAVTLAVAARHARPEIAAGRNALYLAALARHGADAVALDAATPAAGRAEALAGMDGLLLSGGPDLDPARYGRPNEGSGEIDAERDELEAAALAAAARRGVPVLGICRGFQVLNALSGGTLLQHVDGHHDPGWEHGQALLHPIRLVPGSLTATILGLGGAGGELLVNSFHHQAVRPEDLAPGFRAAAYSDGPGGPLVEALEAADGPWRVGVQCHPERTDSTPEAFEGLFAAFVSACRPA